MRKVGKLIRFRQDAVILHASIRIHVSFDHQRVFRDRPSCEAKIALLQDRFGRQHERNIRRIRLYRHRRAQKGGQKTKRQHRCNQSCGRGYHEHTESILQADTHALEVGAAAPGGLMRNRESHLK